MPEALISSTTSPWPGVGSGISMMSSRRSPGKVMALIGLLQSVFFPSLLDQRAVIRVRLHRWREALVVPFLPALEVPVARGVEQYARPRSRAKLLHVALFQRRARVQ